ncbi:MAG: M1 family metallopeptidase [Chitinophagales bacterium]
MMNFKFLFLGAFTAVVMVSACNTSKQSIKQPQAYVGVMEEDTLEEITLNFQKERTYRASYPMVFNLLHTKLEVQVDWEKKYLPGKATLTLKPHFYPADTLVLDAKGMAINEVALLERNALPKPMAYSYDSQQIRIPLGKFYTAKDTLRVFIDYVSKPDERKAGGSVAISSDKGLYFINPSGKEAGKPIQLWTQGETEASSCWFPTIEATNQRCTDEIAITCEKKYTTLSNGILTATKDLGNGLKTDTWVMDLPHAPYLFMITVGEFAVIKDKWRNIAVDYYVEPEYAAYAKDIFGNTPEMMEFFSKRLNYTYPWQKYSQVIVRDYVSGAMENTSASLFGEFVQRNKRELMDLNFEDIVAHELFHQWFGDLVTCESWSNLPLNESFANYGEYLWAEHKYGQMEADRMLQQNLKRYIDESQNKNVDLIRFYYDDREEMFDRHSYEKGGHVLHMLRHIVGDEAFFKSLELYLKTYAFQSVEIHQLRMAFEAVTGRDMNWFFNQWFLNNGHPKLNFTYAYEKDTAYVIAEQKHNTDKEFIYELPFKIQLWNGTATTTYPVTLKHARDTFKFYSKAIPDLIDADADRVLLCGKKENKRLDEYVFQYQKHPLFTAKMEALQKLKDAQNENVNAKSTLIAALSDSFYFIRKYAVEHIKFNADSAPEIVAKVKSMALSDKHPNVRTAAVQKISKIKNRDLLETFIKCLSDSSYATQSEALKAINAIDTAMAMQLAKPFEGEASYDLNDAVCAIYAASTSEKYNNFFLKKFTTVKGYGKYPLMYHYAHYLFNMNKSTILSGVETLKLQALGTETKLLASAGKGAIKRIVKQFEEKKKALNSDAASGLAADYDTIITAANEAISAINKKTEEEKKN